MESSLTLARDRMDASAVPAATLHARVAAALSDCRLLRAVSAGWLTPDDMTVVVPFLAFQHDAVTRGIHATLRGGTDSVAIQALDACGRQLLEHDKALCATRATRLPEDTLPGFAKHFSQRNQAIGAQATREAVADICGVGLLVGDLVLTALARALEKSGAACRLDPVALPGAVTDRPFDATAGTMLALNLEFLDDVYGALRFERVRGLSDRIQSRISLEDDAEPPIAMYPGVGEIMCEERDDKRDIAFTVERYPCTAEVLDPRVVRIPPGKTNNRHKHAHETLFYFIEGVGEILVGEKWTPVKAGDAVFSPRWAIHQTRNTGTTELTLLAITDYYLTSQIYIGKYDKI